MPELPASKRIGPGDTNSVRHTTVFKDGRHTFRISALVSHDDHCKNGHNTFSITADLDRWIANVGDEGRLIHGRWRNEGGGCLHDEIAKHIPALEPYLKWHLTSTDGPMHYIENTLFQAGDKDCWGKRKGEPKQWEYKIKVGNDPVLHTLDRPFVKWLMAEYTAGARIFDAVEVPHKDTPGESYKFAPKYTFKGYRADRCEWYQCPFETLDEAKQWASAINFGMLEFHKIAVAWGEGSEPDLEAARRSAVWPNATLAELRSKDTLEARLPALMAEFKAAVESLRLVY